jgi:hypothetical protein
MKEAENKDRLRFARSILLFSFCIIVAGSVIYLSSEQAQACGCGCSVFSVGTSSLLPTHEGGWFFLEYDYMDQKKNWSGTSSAPLADNEDKDLETHFFDAGVQYMFNRSWGIRADVPVWKRHFETTDEDSGDIVGFDHTAMGDIRIKGVFSGLSEDMSSGFTLGLKLPTGDYKYANFDRDSAIGTGSTDVMIGAYHMANLAGKYYWYANGEVQLPFAYNGDYKPGNELNVVFGVYYGGWNLGPVRLSPTAQVIGTEYLHDRGSLSSPDNTGYERILLSPGLEANIANLRIYGEVDFPVYQQVRGNQLVADAFFKVNMSYSF